MLRVVIDTDVPLSAFISPEGASRQLVLGALDGKFDLLLSTPPADGIRIRPTVIGTPRSCQGNRF
jgi:predicted nucleic acid-binding protein